MAKNNNIKNIKESDEMEDFDFSEFMEDYDEENMAGFTTELLKTSQCQMELAIKLTTLASNNKDMTEDMIFATYKKALDVVIESYPLHALYEKVSSKF